MNKRFNKPDLNAPRFRPKRTNILNKSLFDAFMSKFPEYEGLTLQQFKEIILTFNEEVYNGVINNRDGIELPEGLGVILMGTCPPAKRFNLDVTKALQYGVTANHKNWDSDNNLLKIFFSNHKSKYPLLHKQVWAFKAVKQFRQAASAAYKKNWTMYIVVEPTQKISALFAKLRKRDYIAKEVKNIPDDYNEFKM